MLHLVTHTLEKSASILRSFPEVNIEWDFCVSLLSLLPSQHRSLCISVAFPDYKKRAYSINTLTVVLYLEIIINVLRFRYFLST